MLTLIIRFSSHTMDEQFGAQRGNEPDAGSLQQRELSSLIEFETHVDARRIDRLVADQDLITTLELSGFAGRDWEVFADALARYGFQVMRSWIASGKVFAECKKKGWGGSDLASPIDGFSHQDVLDLTEDTVATAIVKFRDTVLKQHRWKPQGGASLKTFFIGQCLLRFPNLFRQWRNHQRGTRKLDTALRNSARTPRDDRSVESILETIEDPTVREIVRLAYEGYDQDEIAEALGTTIGAVESKLYRFRQKARTA